MRRGSLPRLRSSASSNPPADSTRSSRGSRPSRQARPDPRMPVYADPADGRRVSPVALREWTQRVVEWAGTPGDIAADVAEILVASDRRGIASHGTARLPNYLALIEAGVMDPAARPVRDPGRPALGRFDARNGWGHHAARVAVDWAIDAARELGVATAVVAHTNHYGI